MLNILLNNAKREDLSRILQSCEWGDENIMEITFKLKIFLIHVNEVEKYVEGLHNHLNHFVIPLLESCVILTLVLLV
jgi:hypothetical protein